MFPAGVTIGLVIVGATDVAFQTAGESKGPNSLITGDLLIIVAQVVSACQMVYEEKYVAGNLFVALKGFQSGIVILDRLI